MPSSEPVAMLRTVRDGEWSYPALMFICPGCTGEDDHGSGLHMLPVGPTGDTGRPSWTWSGSLEAPTLEPSILTRWADVVCHSYLRNGVIEFLSDCTHKYAGQHVPLPPLPLWLTEPDDQR